jgi:hypothetical protein
VTLRGAYSRRSGGGPCVVRVADLVTPRDDRPGPGGPGVPGVGVAVPPILQDSGPRPSSFLDHLDHLDQTLGDKGFRGPGSTTEPGPTRTTETVAGATGSGGATESGDPSRPVTGQRTRATSNPKAEATEHLLSRERERSGPRDRGEKAERAPELEKAALTTAAREAKRRNGTSAPPQASTACHPGSGNRARLRHAVYPDEEGRVPGDLGRWVLREEDIS